MTIRHPPTLFFFIFSPSNSFAITLYTHTHTAGRVLLGIPPNNKGQISTIYFSSVFPREMTTGVVEQLSLSLSSSNLFFFYTYTSNTRWGLIGWTCKYRPEKKKRNLLYIYISILLLLLLFSREMCLYIYTLFCTSFSLSIFQILFFNNSACVCLCAALLTSSIIKRRQKLYLFIYLFFFFVKNCSGVLLAP